MLIILIFIENEIIRELMLKACLFNIMLNGQLVKHVIKIIMKIVLLFFIL